MIKMLMCDQATGNVRHSEIECPLNRLIRKTGFQQERGVPIRYTVGVAGAAGAETLDIYHGLKEYFII